MSEHDTILHAIVREAPDLSDSTKRIYLSDLDAWVAFASINPNAWTRAKAQEFYSSLLSRMKSQSANRIMATLTYAANWWATREQDPRLNFAVIQKAPNEQREEKEALTDEEAKKLIQVAMRHPVVSTRATQIDRPWALRDTALIIIGLETGMRRISLGSMLIERIGISPKQGIPIAEVKLKGQRGHSRYPVPLSEAATAALNPWLAFLREHNVTKGSVWRSLSKRIGGVQIGKSLTSQGIYTIILGLAKEAELPNLTPHILRHTFISWRLRDGWTPQQIAAVTGHQLPRTMTGVANADIGAMSKYADPKVFMPTVSTATPDWLSTLVKEKS